MRVASWKFVHPCRVDRLHGWSRWTVKGATLGSLLAAMVESSLAWSALITLHLPWWICIGFHTRSALHTNCVWSCSSACVVLPLLILLTIALVLLWCLVDRLWDLLLMVTLLFLVIGLTGVWDLLRWRAPAVGMLCLLIWGLPLLV